LISKSGRNEVRGLRSWPVLIYSTAHSHKYATGAPMQALLDPQNSCEFNHKISWKKWVSFHSGRGMSPWRDLVFDPLFTIIFHLVVKLKAS
jgi:hypothetical protein